LNVHSTIPPLYYVAIALLVVGRFLARELKERKLLLSRIYVLPGILGIIALALLIATVVLFPETTWLVAGEALITLGVGFGIGLAVSHFTTLRVTDDPDAVYVLGSYATVAIWIGAFALRWAARVLVPFGHGAATLSANAALVVMLAAALGMLRYRVRYEARVLREQHIATPVSAI
jgi:hypothetical protein